MPQDVLLETYDAIVVGSGATGGWAATAPVRSGTESRIGRSGPGGNSEGVHPEHMPAFNLKYRGHSPEIMRTRPIQRQCYACMEYNYEWFVTIWKTLTALRSTDRFPGRDSGFWAGDRWSGGVKVIG